jgi:ribosomal protein S18 acetylase RimI-like enzyme
MNEQWPFGYRNACGSLRDAGRRIHLPGLQVPAEGVPGDFPWFSPIAEALMKIDGAYEAKRPGLVLGEALDLWMVGVSPCTQFAREGIASTLFRLCADLGRTRDFKRCVTECTGYYSQTAARNSGFKERARLAYRDFSSEGRAVFAGIEPPHTDLILFEREF